MTASPSASGTASQIPSAPIKIGSPINAATNKTKVRIKERNPDTSPLEKAVKRPDARIFNPVNKKDGANNRKP